MTGARGAVHDSHTVWFSCSTRLNSSGLLGVSVSMMGTRGGGGGGGGQLKEWSERGLVNTVCR